MDSSDLAVHRDCGFPWTEHRQKIVQGNVVEPICPAGDSAAVEDDDVRGKPFQARYNGRCALGDRIRQDEAVQYVNGALQHVSCPDDPDEDDPTVAPLARPVCQGCWTELPVSLVCGTCD